MEEFINFVDRHHKPIFIGVVVIGAAFILWTLITAISLKADKKTYLTLSFAPTEAALTINGTDYRTGTYEFQPGKYTGELHYEGFTPKMVEIEVKNEAVTTVTEYLVNEQQGLAYYEKHAADIEVLRHVSDSKDVGDFLASYDQKYSLMEQLPLDASFDNRADSDFPGQDLVMVSIRNGNMHKKCEGTLCLLVVGKKVNKNKVKSVLSEKGYKIEDYEVIYEKE